MDVVKDRNPNQESSLWWIKVGKSPTDFGCHGQDAPYLVVVEGDRRRSLSCDKLAPYRVPEIPQSQWGWRTKEAKVEGHYSNLGLQTMIAGHPPMEG